MILCYKNKLIDAWVCISYRNILSFIGLIELTTCVEIICWRWKCSNLYGLINNLLFNRTDSPFVWNCTEYSSTKSLKSLTYPRTTTRNKVPERINNIKLESSTKDCSLCVFKQKPIIWNLKAAVQLKKILKTKIELMFVLKT